jgi:hypothetical protein
MKLLNIALLTLSLIAPHFAVADDIYGHGNQYIRVTEIGSKKSFVKFELCLLDNSKPCELIGGRAYSKVELTKLRNSEKKDVALAVLADVGLVIVAVYGGAFVGAVASSSVAVAPMVGVSAGVTGGSIGSGYAIATVDAINPAEQYRQVDMLSSEVINDLKVVRDRDIEDIVHTLKVVLSNLD